MDGCTICCYTGAILTEVEDLKYIYVCMDVCMHYMLSYGGNIN